MKKRIERISDGIIHVTYTPDEGEAAFFCDTEECGFPYEGRDVITQTEMIFTVKTVYRCEVAGAPVIRKKMTANGEVSYIENAKRVPDHQAYSASLTFRIGSGELLLGLGQYEDGIFNYRNRTEYLYESNMRIAIPFLITTGHYGIFLDTESALTFTSSGDRVRFDVDTTRGLSYYVFLADGIPALIKCYHRVTGQPSLLPRWAFGYMQSKERYVSGAELVAVATKFREKQIPIDCLVQDWCSWEESLWGEKLFDRKRYPDLAGTVRTLHDVNIRFMVSIWPNMSPESTNYAEFKEINGLLPNSNLYDVFSADARKLYWEQCQREIMESGTDALWCDNAEPFSDADWSGERKKPEELRFQVVTDASRESMEWERLNAYGLYHAQGIYENWRASYPKKRVVNLTRSGYAGSQAYGTILWSGDITAKWETLKRQIVEGMKMNLTGMPYWTLDIGGFFVVKDQYENRGCNDTAHLPLWFWQGDYNEGVLDAGYRELYVRWLQFGTFLPIMRSHGTDTPREPWQFGEAGDPFYETILSYLRLRYRLLPYLYSIGAAAHFESEAMMRPLVMDDAADPVCASVTDEFLLGSAFLVAPVCEPMYYGADSVPLSGIPKKRSVYLPRGNGWYDYDTNDYYEGGQWISADAPLEKMPVFVRAGAIVPVSAPLQYADELGGAVEKLLIYEGADGVFTLYLDAGDGYEYEAGAYCRMELSYEDEKRALSTRVLDGTYPAPESFAVEYVGRGD